MTIIDKDATVVGDMHRALFDLSERVRQQRVEIEHLRGLLREARGSIDWGAPDFQLLIDRIDAALDANSAANRVVSGISDKPAAECPE